MVVKVVSAYSITTLSLSHPPHRGLHKIVNSISSMRNISSDAHGVGASIISVSERETLLVANSAIMLSEYWLGVFEKK